MIYILHGEDDFSKREFLQTLRREVGSSELLEANTNLLDATGLTSNYLLGVCNAVPFLAEHRLVIVEGLLGQFDNVRPAARSRRPGGARGALEEWQEAASTLAQIPSTTILVFSEGTLRRNNLVLGALSSVAQVRLFPLLSGETLERWIRQRAADGGATITSQAVRRLMDLVGGNLWVLGSEIEKLALYTGASAPIGEGEVDLLVAHARESSIFRAVDAILERRSAAAMQLIGWLRQEGAAVSYILTMLARQLRLLLLAQELRGQGLTRLELGQRLGGLAEFAVRQVEDQARRHSYDQIVAMYRKLLDTDLAIKRGEMDEDLALETLVAELSSGLRPKLGLPNHSVSH